MRHQRASITICMTFLLAILLGYSEVKAEVQIRIFSQLGVGQVRENTTITVGGVTSTLQLDEQTPGAAVTFYGPESGQYHASFQSTTYFYHQGRLLSVYGAGEGTITSVDDADFELVMDASTTPATIGLESR